MNTTILQKCVEELKKSEPKIDYILGMLETLIDLSGGQIKVTPVTYNSKQIIENGSGLDTSIPDSYVARTGPIAKLG